MQEKSSLRSYCAHPVPQGTALDQVELLANAKALRAPRLKAENAECAAHAAHHVTGLSVHSVERVDQVAA